MKSGSPNLVFNDITSSNIWQCASSMVSGGTAQRNIGKQLLAAFNRGQMNAARPLSLSDSSCPNPATTYYQGAPDNLLASSFHTWSSNGLTYGFGYDHVCSQNPSFNTTGAMASLLITSTSRCEEEMWRTRVVSRQKSPRGSWPSIAWRLIEAVGA